MRQSEGPWRVARGAQGRSEEGFQGRKSDQVHKFECDAACVCVLDLEPDGVAAGPQVMRSQQGGRWVTMISGRTTFRPPRPTTPASGEKISSSRSAFQAEATQRDAVLLPSTVGPLCAHVTTLPSTWATTSGKHDELQRAACSCGQPF